MNNLQNVGVEHPVTGAFRNAARELYAHPSGGTIEIDGSSTVTETENGGAWVAAWVWIDKSHLPDELLEAANHPEPL